MLTANLIQQHWDNHPCLRSLIGCFPWVLVAKRGYTDKFPDLVFSSHSHRVRHRVLVHTGKHLKLCRRRSRHTRGNLRLRICRCLPCVLPLAIAKMIVPGPLQTVSLEERLMLCLQRVVSKELNPSALRDRDEVLQGERSLLTQEIETVDQRGLREARKKQKMPLEKKLICAWYGPGKRALPVGVNASHTTMGWVKRR